MKGAGGSWLGKAAEVIPFGTLPSIFLRNAVLMLCSQALCWALGKQEKKDERCLLNEGVGG